MLRNYSKCTSLNATTKWECFLQVSLVPFDQTWNVMHEFVPQLIRVWFCKNYFLVGQASSFSRSVINMTHENEAPMMFYRSHDWKTPSWEGRSWVMSISKMKHIKLGKKPGFKYKKACNEPQRSCSQVLKREWQENKANTKQVKEYPGGKGIKVSTASSLRLYLHWERVMKSEGESLGSRALWWAEG